MAFWLGGYQHKKKKKPWRREEGGGRREEESVWGDLALVVNVFFLPSTQLCNPITMVGFHFLYL